MDIKALKNEGKSIRQIADLTGFSRNTVRKVLRGEHPGKFRTPAKASKLDPFKEYLTSRYKEFSLSAVRLHGEIKQLGYTGSVLTVRRFLHPLKEPARRHLKATVRFETPPGKQAQADWAHCGHLQLPSGQKVPVYAFVMVLSFSRFMFIHFTTSMKLPVLLECHQKAFEFFGGVPQTLLYDNMKQIRVGPGKFHDQFLDFCNHYSFTPKTHRPYRPRTKGKVERMVNYIKDNFLAGRTFEGVAGANAQALNWLSQTANVRTHATTGRVPLDLFNQEEKSTLQAFSAFPVYSVNNSVQRTVSWESMVHYQGSRYSVPAAYAGQPVQLSSSAGLVVIRAGEVIIAEHPQAAKPHQCIVNKEHLADLWKLLEAQTALPEKPRWKFETQIEVQQRSLQAYEEVA
jgi:transposase